MEHANNLNCDIIVAKDYKIYGVTVSGSLVQYTPAFMQGGSLLNGYMRVGPQVTEFGMTDYVGSVENYSGIWLGRAARRVASGQDTDGMRLPVDYAYADSTENRARIVAYIHSPLTGENPGLLINKPNGGLALQTNGVIRAALAGNVERIFQDETISNSASVVLCTNTSYSITVTLPTSPIEGQVLLIIQTGTGKVRIYCKDGIYTSGSSVATKYRESGTIGTFNILSYADGKWRGVYVGGPMSGSNT